MTRPTYEVLVQGNNLRLRHDFLGISSVTLIRSQRGLTLFDTGGYTARLGLLRALALRDLKPADIEAVFLSHLHFDHAHNIDLFPDAEIIVSRREWEYARSPHRDDLLIPWGIHHQLGKSKLRLITGDGTLDEGVTFFPAPGHTPGCYALELDTEAFGTVIIAGDAIKYVKEAILKACDMAFDTREAGTQTIQHILGRAARIVPGHFPELIRQPDGTFSWDETATFELMIR